MIVPNPIIHNEILQKISFSALSNIEFLSGYNVLVFSLSLQRIVWYSKVRLHMISQIIIFYDLSTNMQYKKYTSWKVFLVEIDAAWK